MKYIKALLAVILLVALDQIVKVWTLVNLKGQSAITWIDGVFELSYVENRGAAFGMLQNKVWVFALFTLIVAGAMVYIYYKIPSTSKYNLLRIALVTLFSGAIGNLIDRVGRQYVVDMFHFYWFEFPVFNVADMYVVVSCFGLMTLMLFYYKDEDLEFLGFKK